ncbi:benzoate 4-monooxygenase cytochrome P450 [Pochonia chlamydosporia 170]|uniref:Benzoate 4-monooxygenase cytochrome P450 n=1 Tax=Pochonia chlamydosporia 170 TaxID=1380566 RepID=A0A179F1A9_METCM|nr:benzoate 4-monooxygenase cytochrome P450 [Pochonia chlamydosporia 170]OAQ59226.2 benzoate 4-monooxygenase cytochrome P450 [Pochonia chlamydosporia 170]
MDRRISKQIMLAGILDTLRGALQPRYGLIEVVALVVLAWAIGRVWTYSTSPLRKYPGPYLAGWTNLWRFYHVLKLNSHLVVDELHRKYGPVVRIGPNLLSLSDPSLIKTIYKFENDWEKTEFYHGGSTRSWTGKVTYNIFGISDRKEHARVRRPIGKLYSMSYALGIEKHVDNAISQLWEELETRFIEGQNKGKSCELDQWFLYYCWDVVGDITFSQPFGYMKHGYDFDGSLADSEMAMNYLATVGQIPVLDFAVAQNPILKLLSKAPFTTANTIARERLENRLAGKDGHIHDVANPDFLDGFIEAQKSHQDIVTSGQLQSYLLINLIAGADTTAITLTATVYLGLKHPKVWQRLENEVLSAKLPTDRPISYKEARELPYLDAVIREAMRLHPAVGMPLERYVPSSGLHLPDGSFVPEGFMVGMNPYIVNRTSPFGEDSEVFRPERWLQGPKESVEKYNERLHGMNNADITFGAGSRMCGGRHIANLEIYKVISTLVQRYKLELVDPEKEWTVKNGWFLRLSGVNVRMERR